MKKINKSRLILTTSLLIIFTLGSTGIFDYNLLGNMGQDLEINEIDQNHEDFLIESSSYINEQSKTTSDVNLSIGMDYVSNTPQSMGINNDESQSLEIPAPVDQYFNTTSSNITVSNIEAQNKTINYETFNKRNSISATTTEMASITVESNCNIENASFYLNVENTNAEFGVYLHNSTWNGTRNVPLTDYVTLNSSYIPGVSGDAWITTLFSSNNELDTSKTTNNTWYIRLRKIGGDGTANWYYETDSENKNDADCFYYSGGWHLIKESGLEVDLALIVGLSTGDTQKIETFENRGYSTESTQTASIYVPTNCYLTNTSFYLNIDNADAVFGVYLHNSTWNGTRNVPTTNYVTINSSYTPGLSGDAWVTILFSSDNYLNTSLTANNTWYIRIRKTSGTGNAYWQYEADGPRNNDADCFYYSGGWQLLKDGGKEVDLGTIASFAPTLSSQINASDIGLKINGTSVTDKNLGGNTGEWTSTDVLSSQPGGLIDYNFTIDYWSATWNVNNITVNYTKSDLDATPTFTATPNSEINWEINKTINNFNSTFENYYITYTVPDAWTVGKAYNWTDEYTPVINNVAGAYQEATIYNAGNSSTAEWSLQCTSPNFANNISIDVESVNSTEVDITDVLDFTAGFDEPISGDVNLTVYSPSGYINYSHVVSITDQFEISFPSYDLSENVTELGEFAVQFSWNNDTHVAYWEQNITVIGDTDLYVSSTHPSSYLSEDIFDVSIYFNDTYFDEAIEGATIEYKINDGSLTSDGVTEIGTGTYNITVPCWDIAEFGVTTIDITASKTGYNDNSTQFTFTLYNATEQNLPATEFSVIRGNNVTIGAEYYYNDSVSGIEGASLEWEITNAGFEYSYTDDGNGAYSIELDSSTIEGSTTPYTLNFNLTSGFNETQQYSVDITVLNRTEVWIISLSQPDYETSFTSAPYSLPYGADILVTAKLVDIDNNNEIITGGEANITYQTVTYYNTTDSNGEFSFLLDADTLAATSNEGFTININATNYETSLNSSSFTIVECESYLSLGSVDAGNGDMTYNAGTYTYEDTTVWGSDIDVTVQWLNLYTDSPIDTATTQQIDFNGNTHNDGAFSVDSWSWTIASSESAIYNNSVEITFDQGNYASVSTTFGVWLQPRDTDLSIAIPSANYTVYNPSTFNVSIYLEDLEDSSALDGATITCDLSGEAQSGTITWNNGSSGYYEIEIDANALSGNYSLKIEANKTNYNNYSIYYDFYVNTAPTIINTDNLINLNEWNQTENFAGFNIDFDGYESDSDLGIGGVNDQLTWSITSSPTVFGHGVIDADTLSFSSVLDTVGRESFTLRVTDNYGLTDEITLYFNVTGRMNIFITSGNNESLYYNNDTFIIEVYLFSSTRDEVYTTGTVEYSVNGGSYTDVNVNDLGNGYHEITINGWDFGSDDFGLNDIDIRATGSDYVANYTLFGFTLNNATQGFLDEDEFTVVKYDNITIVVNYQDNNSVGIPNAQLEWAYDNDAGWEYSWQDQGNGVYHLIVNSSGMLGVTTPYNIEFNITSGYNETQYYSANVQVLNRTEVWIVSLSQPDYSTPADTEYEYDMYYGANTQVIVKLVDIDNGYATITGGQANLTFSGTTYFDLTDESGEFSFTIPTDSLNAGSNPSISDIQINATNYETSSNSTDFNVIACPTSIDYELVQIDGSDLTYQSSDYTYYEAPQGFDITLRLRWINSLSNAEILSATTSSVDFNNGNIYAAPTQSGNYFEWTLGASDTTIYNNTVDATFDDSNYVSSNLVFGVWLTERSSELGLITPANYSIHVSDDNFNVIVFFNDLEITSGIDGSTISYDIDGEASGTISVNNGTTGYYAIPVNCAGLTKGNHTIVIWANKTYFENQTFNYDFYINTPPTITDQDLILNLADWNKTENYAQFTVDFSAYQNDPDIAAISDTLQWSVENGPYATFTSSELDVDSIQFTAIADQVGRIGFTLRLTDSYSEYSEMTVYFNVTGRMNIFITSLNNESTYYNDDTFDIEIYLHSSTRDAYLTGATIEYSISGGAYTSTNWIETGNGYYTITINGWDFAQEEYGDMDIDIKASLSDYVSNSTNFEFTLIYITGGDLDQDEFNVIRGDNITIIANYYDNESVGIPNANLNWAFDNNPGWIHSWTDETGGVYYLEIDTSNMEGTSTAYTIDFNITSQWNQTQYYSVSVYVWNRTEVQIVSISQPDYGYTDSEAPFEVYYGADVLVSTQLIDLDNGNAIIEGAAANLTYSGQTFYDLVDESGIFTFTLDTDAIDVSTQTITDISINKTYFETNSLTNTNFDIVKCPTYSSVSDILIDGLSLNYWTENYTYYGESYGTDITIQLEWYNAQDDSLITIENANFDIDFNTNTLSYDTFSSNTYEWIVDYLLSQNGNNTVDINVATTTNYEATSDSFGIWLLNATTELTLESIYNDNWESTFSVDRYYTYQVYDTVFTIRYRDTNNSLWIDGTNGNATLVLNISNTFYYYYNVSGTNDGFFQFTVSPLPNGLYDAILLTNHSSYDDGFFEFKLEFSDIPTQMVNISFLNIYGDVLDSYDAGSNKYTAKTGANITFLIQYLDTIHNVGISGGAGTFTEFYAGDIETYNTTISGGYISFELDYSNYAIGEIPYYDIDITKANYDGISVTFQIEWVQTQTSASITIVNQTDGIAITGSGDPIRYVIYRGNDTTITALYWDIDGDQAIEGATATLHFNGADYLTTTNSTGHAKWLVDTDSLTAQIYTDNYVLFTNDTCVQQSINFEFDVKLVQTEGVFAKIYQPDHSPYGSDNLTFSTNQYQAWMSYDLSIEVSYEDLKWGGWINDATANLWLDGQMYSQSSISDGVYTWTGLPIAGLEGEYSIQIEIGKTHWENASFTFNIYVSPLPNAANLMNITQPDHTGYENDNLTIDGNGYYFAYTAYGIRITYQYFDLNNTVPITGATASITIDGSNGPSATEPTNGIYVWDIPMSSLDIDNKSIEITFEKQYYDNESVSFTINVQTLPDSFEMQSITQPDHSGYENDDLITTGEGYYVAYTAYGVRIIYQYSDTNNTVGITGATASLTIGGQTGPIVQENGEGEYQWDIPLSSLSLGNNVIEIIIEKQYYNNDSVTFTIQTQLLPDSLSLYSITQPDHGIYATDELITNLDGFYLAYSMYDVTIIYRYYDLNNTANIAGATAILTIDGSSGPEAIEQLPGFYKWTIDVEDLVLGENLIEITLQKQHFENESASLTVLTQVLPDSIAMDSITQPDHTGYGTDHLLTNTNGFYVAYTAYGVQITYTYNDLNNSLGITGATATIEVRGEAGPTVQDQGNGQYIWDIPASQLMFGNNFIEITINKQHYENESTSFTIYGNWLPTQVNEYDLFQLVGTTEEQLIKQGDNHIAYAYFDTITIELQYFDTNNSEILSTGVLAFMQIGSGPYQGGTWSALEEVFSWTIDTSDLTSGLNDLHFTFNSDDYVNQNVLYNVSLTKLDVSTTLEEVEQFDQKITPTGGKYILYDSETDLVTITCSFIEDQFSTPAEGLSVTLTVEGTTISKVGTTDSNGNVSWTFAITELPADYNIDIDWSAGSSAFNGDSQEDVLVITTTYRTSGYSDLEVFDDPANELELITDTGILFQYAYAGNDISVYVYFFDQYNSQPFADGLMNLTMIGGNSYTDTSSSMGVFSVEIPAEDISGDLVRFELELSKYLYINTTVAFNISVISKTETRFTLVNPPSSLVQGEDATFTIRLEQMAYGEASWSPANAKEIEFEVDFGDNVEKFISTAMTDDQGEVTFSFTVPINAEKIEMEIVYDGNYRIDSELNSLEVELIPRLKDFTWLIIIVIVGSAGIIMGIIITKQKNKPRPVPASVAKERAALKKLQLEMQPSVDTESEQEYIKSSESNRNGSQENGRRVKIAVSTTDNQKPKIKVTHEIKDSTGNSGNISRKQQTNSNSAIKSIKEANRPKSNSPSTKGTLINNPSFAKQPGVRRTQSPVSKEEKLMDQIEQTTIKLLFNTVIPTKQVLINTVKRELDKLKIIANETQITDVINKMTEERKIGFNRKAPAPGWKLII